jgi:hypothetical protein
MFTRLILACVLSFASGFAHAPATAQVRTQANIQAPAQALSKSEAPLGLIWGASATEIKARGVDLHDVQIDSFGTTFSASQLPKPIADAEQVTLSFGNDDKLWRIAVKSRAYEGDPFGHAVKARYQDLIEVLDEKYGRGTSHHQVDTDFWKAPNEFVIGIKAGRTTWHTNYDTPSLSIEIGIVGANRDDANWRIMFEKKQLRSAFEKSRKSIEKDAL